MEYPKNVYGYVFIDEQKFAFVLENFHLRIFNGITGVISLKKKELDNVLFGITDNNYNIAIKIGASQQGMNCIVASVYYFVIGTASLINYDLSKFYKVLFVGGNINSIIDPTIIYEDVVVPNGDDKAFFINFKPVQEVSYSVQTKLNNIDVMFERTIYPYEKRKGNNLGITNSVLSLRFFENQDISTLNQWITFVSRLISLLVGQKNIECESCSIFFKAEKDDGTANVYFNLKQNERCDKKSIRCISLINLDNNLEKLLKLIADNDFSVEFLPKTNDDTKFITYEDIKNICTALEFEYEKSDICKQKNNDIKELVDNVKSMVKTFRESTTKLSEKFYQYINSNIETWQFPATEKFISLLKENETLIRNVLSNKDAELLENDIQQFVKFRNLITHGKKPAFNSDILGTAFSLKYMIYICVLKRIGLSDKEIEEALRLVWL